jgi:hypothetical protein
MRFGDLRFLVKWLSYHSGNAGPMHGIGEEISRVMDDPPSATGSTIVATEKPVPRILTARCSLAAFGIGAMSQTKPFRDTTVKLTITRTVKWMRTLQRFESSTASVVDNVSPANCIALETHKDFHGKPRGA